MSRYAGGLSKPDVPAYGRYPVAGSGGGGSRDAGHDLFPSDDPVPPSGSASMGITSSGFLTSGAESRQAMLEKQRQLAAQRNKQRMVGGITMTEGVAADTTATLPMAGSVSRRTTTVSRGAPVQSAPRGTDSLFDDSQRHSRGSGGGGWTDFPPQRDHTGSFSGRDSEHSDREGGGGGSALAEALALRERERKRTMEERAAQERSEKQRMEVSAVYDPPAAAAHHAALASPPPPAATPLTPPSSRPVGRLQYEAEVPPSAGPAGGHHHYGGGYGGAAATGSAAAPPLASPGPVGAGQGRPPAAAATSEYAAHSTSGDAAAAPPQASYSSGAGGGGAGGEHEGGFGYPPHAHGGGHSGYVGGAASSAGGGAPRHAAPPPGDEGDGPLMAVAPLMLSPAATAAAAAAAYPAGLAPLDLSDMRRFLTTPTPRAAGIVQCYIVRDRSGISNRMYPVYSAFLKDGDRFLMASKKRSQNKTSNYLVSLDKRDLNRDGPSFVGKVRSNFVGTEFIAFDDGIAPDTKPPPTDRTHLRQEVAVVNYASNVLGSRGPRKMKVAVPKVTADGRRVVFQPESEEESMMARFKAGYIQDMVLLVNKPPKWNESVGAYVLNFNGRVTMASVKNFQLVSPDDHEAVLLQFGRTGKDVFTMDYQWPLSPLQAFSICMSSFDYKLACE